MPGPQTERCAVQTCANGLRSAAVYLELTDGEESGRTSFWWAREQKKRSTPALAHGAQRVEVGTPQMRHGWAVGELMLERKARPSGSGWLDEVGGRRERRRKTGRLMRKVG